MLYICSEFIERILIICNLNIFTLGLYKNGSVNNALKTIFENKDYLKLVASTLGNGAQEIKKVIQVS